MIWLILRRLGSALLVIWLLFTLTFFLIRLAPGDPFAQDRDITAEAEAELNRKFHLDKPLLDQYWIYLKNYCTFGTTYSFKNKDKTVNDIIATHLPTSLILGAWALVLAVAIGCSAGVYSAVRPNTWGDYLAMGATVIGISLPAFVFGPMLQLGFSMRWGLLPVSGYDSWQHLVLPAVTLSLPFAARIARLMRAGMLDVLSQDFIRTARAKGLSERVIIWRHALRGGMLPVVTFLGPAIAAIVTGSLVVEQIFNIPGLGREFVESALARDYTLAEATTMVYGVLIILCNAVVDISYRFLDPRVKGRS